MEVFQVRLPNGQVWMTVMYRPMAEEIVAREAKERPYLGSMTVHGVMEPTINGKWWRPGFDDQAKV